MKGNSDKKGGIPQMLGLIIYVFLSATGLTLIKIGTGQGGRWIQKVSNSNRIGPLS